MFGLYLTLVHVSCKRVNNERSKLLLRPTYNRIENIFKFQNRFSSNCENITVDKTTAGSCCESPTKINELTSNSSGIIDHGSMHWDASSTMHTSNLFTYLREEEVEEVKNGFVWIHSTLDLQNESLTVSNWSNCLMLCRWCWLRSLGCEKRFAHSCSSMYCSHFSCVPVSHLFGSDVVVTHSNYRRTHYLHLPPSSTLCQFFPSDQFSTRKKQSQSICEFPFIHLMICACEFEWAANQV